MTVRTVGPQTEIRLRAIFFKFKNPNDRASVKAAEARAKAALRRIAKGEDFSAVAAATTDSPFGKTNGGDLGFMTQPEMGKELADVAFAIENGGVSAPIKTQLGWHVVKVEDKRQRKPVDFETVRDKFEAIVGRRAQQDLITKLRSEARTQRLDIAADAKPASEKSE